jgi:hypothetical protein
MLLKAEDKNLVECQYKKVDRGKNNRKYSEDLFTKEMMWPLVIYDVTHLFLANKKQEKIFQFFCV